MDAIIDWLAQKLAPWANARCAASAERQRTTACVSSAPSAGLHTKHTVQWHGSAPIADAVRMPWSGILKSWRDIEEPSTLGEQFGESTTSMVRKAIIQLENHQHRHGASAEVADALGHIRKLLPRKRPIF